MRAFNKPMTLLFSVAAAALLSGCGGSIADIANNAIYPYKTANKTPVPENPPAGYGQAMLPYTVQPEGTLQTHLWYYTNTAKPNAPVIIHFHGNGENIGSLYNNGNGFMKKMEELETHFVVIDYPAYGRSTGLPNQRTVMGGVDATLAWTKTRFPNSKIVIWGWSLGAAVGAQTATKPGIYKFVLNSPWTTTYKMAEARFSSLLGMVPPEFFVENEWSSLKAAQQTTIPGLIHHGTNDQLIPFAMGEELAATYAPEKTTFVPLPGRGHGDIFAEQGLWDQIKRFANQ